jgi:hypothetical protein
MNYIQHITLNTAHSRRSLQAEIGVAAIAACQASLALCLQVPGVRAKLATDLPDDMLAYDLTATAAGRCVVATIWRGDIALATIGIAGHSRCGARLWERMHDTQLDLSTGQEDWPQAPWCASRLEPGITRDMDTASWLGDYGRCLAWAWITMERP